MKRLLFSPDPPTDSGAPPADPPVTNPPADPPAPVPASGPAPPAATIVVNSEPSESERNLQAQLDAEKEARKKEQLRLMELEDENRKLKDVTPPGAVAPKKKTVKRFGLLEWEE